MLYDDVLHHIGTFGPYQKLLLSVMSAWILLGSMNVVSQVFLAGSADYWCEVPEWKSCSCSTLNENYSVTYCHMLKKNLSIPQNELGEFLHCSMYALPAEWKEECPNFLNLEVFNQTDHVSCAGHWEYDRSRYKTSIITDFDLVCDRQSLPNMAQSMYFSGVLVGTVFVGTICDRFGRRFGFFLATIATGIFGALVAVSPTFWMYTVFRFFLGASAHNIYMGVFLIMTELVGPSKRALTGMVMAIVFAIGVILLAAVAYFIRTWRLLQLVITLPAFLSLLLLPVLPESPRWLYSMNRNSEAARTILRIARFNRVKLSETFVETLNSDVELPLTAEEEKSSPLELIRLPTMRCRLMILTYIWFTVSLVYYGLILSTESLGVNIYLGFLISGSVEIVGYSLAVLLLDWLGRKLTTGGLLLISGLACIFGVITPPGVAKTVIGMTGKGAISAAFTCTAVYTAELYPTLLRGKALGTCSLTSWVGGILCPVIFILANYWTPLPLVLFFAASIIASAAIILLPETKGITLPETIAEAAQLSKKWKRRPTADEDEKI